MKQLFRKHPFLRIALVLAACVAVFLVVGFQLLRTQEHPVAAPAARPMLIRSADGLFVPEDSPLRTRLAVAPVGAVGAAHVVGLPATVEADPTATVNVLPAATGRVVALKVRLGDTVKRGQLLATISSPDYAQAVADVAKARDAQDLAQRALSRARGVNEAGSNAAKDVEAAESSLVQQTAELRRSEYRWRSLSPQGQAADKTGLLSVTAPISGSVTALTVAAGAIVNDATASLMTIANLDHVWVTANVPENLSGSVLAGQDVSVLLAAQPGKKLNGKISFVSTILDADTRRVKARIVFANPSGQLKPNMYAVANVAVPQLSQPQVPSSALLMNNDSVSVFVEVAPWTFVRRMVELGNDDAEQVRVRSGLQAGDRVVVRGGVLLND